MKTLVFAALGFVCLTIGWVRAQTPAPVIIHAATPAPAAAPAPLAKTAGAAADLSAMVQLLQEMQATNAATIKKQEATLTALDELQKAAEDLKIYSKRG
jgi:hypothetical protein